MIYPLCIINLENFTLILCNNILGKSFYFMGKIFQDLKYIYKTIIKHACSSHGVIKKKKVKTLLKLIGISGKTQVSI